MPEDPLNSTASTPTIKVSDLIANPSLMLSLSVPQREALRRAAEGKWLERNPDRFEPLGGIEWPRKSVEEKGKAVVGERQATADTVESRKAKVVERAHDSEPGPSKPSAASKRALAEVGGLVVPVRCPIISPPDNIH